MDGERNHRVVLNVPFGKMLAVKLIEEVPYLIILRNTGLAVDEKTTQEVFRIVETGEEVKDSRLVPGSWGPRSVSVLDVATYLGSFTYREVTKKSEIRVVTLHVFVERSW
jgi:hypothetical protein